MNSDEVNWLLQTIEDPENEKRFVQAQYQRGRIPYHVMASLVRDRNWTDWTAVEKPPKLGGLIDNLAAKGFTVKVFPYGIPVIDEAFLQIGRGN
jgi:hypothetical protein